MIRSTEETMSPLNKLTKELLHRFDGNPETSKQQLDQGLSLSRPIMLIHFGSTIYPETISAMTVSVQEKYTSSVSNRIVLQNPGTLSDGTKNGILVV